MTVLFIGFYPMSMFANLVRNSARPLFQASANPGDVEQPAQRHVTGQPGASQHDARGQIRDMQASVERADREGHDQSGDHGQRQPAKRKWNGKRPAAEDQRAGKSEDVGAQPRPRGADRAVLADQDIGQDHIDRDDRGGVDQVERIASRQQKARMQILLRQDLEDHRDGHDRHGLRGHFAEVGAENDIGDMGGNDGEAQAGRQRDAEQQFDAFAQMRPHRGVALIGVNLHGERKERRRGADRRHHQGLPNQIEPGDISAGVRRADQVGDHESVGDAGDGKQCQRQRQRQALFCHGRKTGNDRI